MSKTISRREMLTLLGAVAGSGAVLKASAAMGMMPDDTPVSVPRLTPLGMDQHRTVAILGSGVSGLAAAHELKKAGYTPVVLEASGRAGGRCFTVRSGDRIDEIGNPQQCDFDDEPHLYFNCGPARIPGTHRNVMHYCKELGVDLEIFINENKEAYFQDDNMLGGRPIKNKEFTTSARGFMAEIMAKSFSSEELDRPLTEWEAGQLWEAIRSFGDLDEDGRYRGSFRAGYASGGFVEHGTMKDPVALRDLLQSQYFRSAMIANEGETGPILFQPTGGMDNIVAGFQRRLHEHIHYNAAVTSVRLQESGVDIAYIQNGVERNLRADYCFNCIPSHIMAGIENNFPARYREAMLYPRRGEAYKSAFQARERFWEKDDIYGGITWTNQPIRQIWYPPHGIHKQKGVILSAYDFAGGMHFTRLSQEERLESAIRQGEKVHPDYRRQVEKGVTVAWHRINHILGCAARWQKSPAGMTSKEEELFNTLRSPAAGRHYFIGDQVTVHSGWMESAIMSAHHALEDMESRIASAAISAEGQGGEDE